MGSNAPQGEVETRWEEATGEREGVSAVMGPGLCLWAVDADVP